MPWPAQERVQAKSELAPSRTRRFCLPHWGTRSARNGEAAATWFGDLAALFSRFVTIVSTFLRTCTAAFATSRPSATGRPREDRDRKPPATGVPSRRKISFHRGIGKNVVAAGRRCALRASSAFKDGGIAGVCAAIDRDRNIRLEAPMKRNHWDCQGAVLTPGGGPPQPLRKPTYPAR